VLQLIANGLTNARAAHEMELGVETVKTHVVKALAKLAANNRAHAVAIALRQGYIE
jgi:DNA-binding NarL/FixJ family response regulator